MVCFNFSFCNLDYHINPSQVVECKMNKTSFIELFVIEEFVIFENVCKILEPLLDVEFSTSDNSISGSKYDIGEHACLDYGSFGLPLSAKKINDHVSS